MRGHVETKKYIKVHSTPTNKKRGSPGPKAKRRWRWKGESLEREEKGIPITNQFIKKRKTPHRRRHTERRGQGIKKIAILIP